MNHELLYRTFERSKYGKQLEAGTRFGTFQPPEISNTQWCEVLGDDVNNLRHMYHTTRLAERFCSGLDMSTHDTNRMLTVAATHDWGEAMIGDIPLPDKTADDESAERIAYAKIARDLVGNPESLHLTSTVWDVLSHEDEEMGDKFKAVEYVGYCTTALRAGRAAMLLVNGIGTLDGVSRAENDKLVSGLMGLQAAVQTHNFGTLAGFAKKYPVIKDMMRETM